MGICFKSLAAHLDVLPTPGIGTHYCLKRLKERVRVTLLAFEKSWQFGLLCRHAGTEAAEQRQAHRRARHRISMTSKFGDS